MDGSTFKYVIDAATGDPATARRLRHGARCVVRLHHCFQPLTYVVAYSPAAGDFVCRLAATRV